MRVCSVARPYTRVAERCPCKRSLNVIDENTTEQRPTDGVGTPSGDDVVHDVGVVDVGLCCDQVVISVSWQLQVLALVHRFLRRHVAPRHSERLLDDPCQSNRQHAGQDTRCVGESGVW